MLTLRDCFVIATLFAIPLAMLRYTPLSGFFFFVPATLGVWLFLVRRSLIPSPNGRVMVAAHAGVALQAIFFLLYEYLSMPGENQVQVQMNPYGSIVALPCFLLTAAIGGAGVASFAEAWHSRSRR
jgi:hypothetical protein